MSDLEKVRTYKEIAPGECAGPCPRCEGAMRFRFYPQKNEGKCLSCGYVLQPEEASIEAFDPQKTQQLISDTYSRVQSLCPKGALEWLDQHRPAVTRHLVEVGSEVDAAYAAEDAALVKKALEKYEAWHLAAWKRYEERPEVMER